MAAAADLEGTLTTGMQVIGILRYFITHGKALKLLRVFGLRVPASFIARLRPSRDKTEPHKLLTDIARLFEGMDEQELTALGTWIVEHELWPKRRPHVVAELQQRQIEGQEIIVCSGVYQPITEAFAQRIHALPLGTPLEMRRGCATGRLAGPINDKDTKIERLQQVLDGRELDYAYGNGTNDQPMLEFSRTPVAVHPHRALRKVAERQGWRILDD